MYLEKSLLSLMVSPQENYIQATEIFLGLWLMTVAPCITVTATHRGHC